MESSRAPDSLHVLVCKASLCIESRRMRILPLCCIADDCALLNYEHKLLLGAPKGSPLCHDVCLFGFLLFVGVKTILIILMDVTFLIVINF